MLTLRRLWQTRGSVVGEIKQPVTTAEIEATLAGLDEQGLGARTIRGIVRELETMGLVET